MKPQVISFHCVLKNHLGQVLSSSYNGEVVTDSKDKARGSSEKSKPSAAEAKAEAKAEARAKAEAKAEGKSGTRRHLRGLVRGLQGVKPGERRQIFVPAPEAYGFYDKDLVIDVPRDDFPDGDVPKVGTEILGEFQDGTPRIFRVIQVTRVFVTLDGNHPLAGQDLIFDIEATDVREATMEDVNGEELTFTPLGYLH